mmetsp:Transcript_130402/g.260154  ORF Transcript_130402/g.260154 Transcript_130402/m.260154 type:complete len:220 (+) Transcript_130402:122-781(+)
MCGPLGAMWSTLQGTRTDSLPRTNCLRKQNGCSQGFRENWPKCFGTLASGSCCAADRGSPRELSVACSAACSAASCGSWRSGIGRRRPWKRVAIHSLNTFLGPSSTWIMWSVLDRSSSCTMCLRTNRHTCVALACRPSGKARLRWRCLREARTCALGLVNHQWVAQGCCSFAATRASFSSVASASGEWQLSAQASRTSVACRQSEVASNGLAVPLSRCL